LYFSKRLRGDKRSEHTHVQGSFCQLSLSLVFTCNIRERSVTFRKPGRPDALTGSNHSGAVVGSTSNSRGPLHPQQGSAPPWRSHGDKNELIFSGKPLLFNSCSHCSFLDIRTRIFQSPLRFRNSSCYLKLLTESRP